MDMNVLITSFNNAKNTVNAIETEMKALKEQILNEMKSRGLKEVKTEHSTAVYEERKMVTYDDDSINIIKNFAPQYIKEKVNNKEIKAKIKDGSLDESKISEYKSETIAKAILIKDLTK